MKVCVVLPTYNEAGTIGEVIARVLASTPDVDILVADDNSPDGTGKLADDIAAREQRVRVLHRPGKAGLGPAYVAGFKDALARAYDADETLMAWSRDFVGSASPFSSRNMSRVIAAGAVSR